MSLFLESGYLNIREILNSNSSFIFIVGARGVGKTYGALKYAIESGAVFGYMRRTQAQADIINKEEFTILIERHTADIGKPIGQINLSIERTKTIRDALIQEGIPEKLFTYKGYGGTRPLATNETEEGRAQNRRVNIIARPKATYIQRDW